MKEVQYTSIWVYKQYSGKKAGYKFKYNIQALTIMKMKN